VGGVRFGLYLGEGLPGGQVNGQSRARGLTRRLFLKGDYQCSANPVMLA
jgi:hypothetical protein